MQARSYGRFIEIKSNFGREKLYRTNQGYNYLGSSFSDGQQCKSSNPTQKGKTVPTSQKMIFLQEQMHRSIRFLINRTRVTWDQKQLEIQMRYTVAITSQATRQFELADLYDKHSEKNKLKMLSPIVILPREILAVDFQCC